VAPGVNTVKTMVVGTRPVGSSGKEEIDTVFCMIWAVSSGGKTTEGSAVVGLDNGNLKYPAKSFAVRRSK
jgi:hypothetical protein